MAFAQSQDNTQKPAYVDYVGMATCKIAGINVSDNVFKQQTGYDRNAPLKFVEEIYNEQTGQRYRRANIEILLQTIPAICNGLSKTFVKRFMVYEILNTSRSGLVQAIDRYGRTVWITPEELKMTKAEKLVGTKKDGSNYIKQIEPMSMRHAYRGEDKLMKFMSSLLFSDDVNLFKKNGESYVYAGVKEDCDKYVCRIDNMETFFNGDGKDVMNAIIGAQNNFVKVAVGLRTKDEKTYSVIHDTILRPFENTRSLQRDIDNEKANGYGLDTIWDINMTIHEYVNKESHKEEQNHAQFVGPVNQPIQSNTMPNGLPTETNMANSLPIDDDLPF